MFPPQRSLPPSLREVAPQGRKESSRPQAKKPDFSFLHLRGIVPFSSLLPFPAAFYRGGACKQADTFSVIAEFHPHNPFAAATGWSAAAVSLAAKQYKLPGSARLCTPTTARQGTFPLALDHCAAQKKRAQR